MKLITTIGLFCLLGVTITGCAHNPFTSTARRFRPVPAPCVAVAPVPMAPPAAVKPSSPAHTPPAPVVPPVFAAVPPAGNPTASDNCGPVTITQDADVIVPGNCPQNYTIRRTYHATDACGNVVSQTQVITVSDTTPPVIGDLPPPSTIECPAVPVFATPTVTDADPNPTVTFADVTTGVCPTVTVRTWSAVDCSGNVAVSKSQTISVADTTPPVFLTFPADTRIEFVRP